MNVMVLVLLVFAAVGVFCVLLIVDFKGLRAHVERAGVDDDHARLWRRRGVLIFAWGGLAMTMYALVGVLISVAVRQFGGG